MNRSIVLALAYLAFTACTQNDLGFQKLKKHDAHGAASIFQQCAKAGDSSCMNNLAAMYEVGLVDGRPNVDMAISYFWMAARWGNPIAQQNLRRLRQQVPEPDLLEAQQLRAKEAAQRRAKAVESIVTAAAEALDAFVAVSAVTSAERASQAPIVVSSTTFAEPTQECTSDMQCGGGGRQCVRPRGSFAKGRCIQPVNQYGMKLYELPPPSAGPREVAGCSLLTDCPIGFDCVKQPGELRGLCLKRQ